MPEHGKEGIELPVGFRGVDMIVDCDQPDIVVHRDFAQFVSTRPAADTSQILANNSVNRARFDQALQLYKFIAIQVLAAAAARDNDPFDRTVVLVGHVLFGQGDLVVQAALILVLGADAGDDDDLEGATIARGKGEHKIVAGHGKPPCRRRPVHESIAPVGQSA